MITVVQVFWVALFWGSATTPASRAATDTSTTGSFFLFWYTSMSSAGPWHSAAPRCWPLALLTVRSLSGTSRLAELPSASIPARFETGGAQSCAGNHDRRTRSKSKNTFRMSQSWPKSAVRMCLWRLLGCIEGNLGSFQATAGIRGLIPLVRPACILLRVAAHCCVQPDIPAPFAFVPLRWTPPLPPLYECILSVK